MNRSLQIAIALILIGAVLPGYATQRVRVNAYLSHELPFPAVDATPPATIRA